MLASMISDSNLKTSERKRIFGRKMRDADPTNTCLRCFYIGVYVCMILFILIILYINEAIFNFQRERERVRSFHH